MKEIIFNEGQLNRFTKKQIIELFLSQQEQLQKQTTQLEELNRKFDLIYEQLTMSRTDRFAQKTEKFDYDQLTLCFNEAEVTIETDCAEEPLIEEVIPEYKRKKDRKENVMKICQDFQSGKNIMNFLKNSFLSCSQLDIGDFQTGFIKNWIFIQQLSK